MNKEYILKLFAVIGALIVGYLISGGIYAYMAMGSNTVRINKITGSVEAIDFNTSSRTYQWVDISTPQSIKKDPIPMEEAAAPAN